MLSYYPSNEDVSGDGLEFVSPLLKLFLKRIIHVPLKCAGLGQGIMQAARPQGFLMPLLFGLGVEADFSGGKKFYTQLARLGFCPSHDVVVIVCNHASNDVNHLTALSSAE